MGRMSRGEARAIGGLLGHSPEWVFAVNRQFGGTGDSSYRGPVEANDDRTGRRRGTSSGGSSSRGRTTRGRSSSRSRSRR